MQTKNKDYIFTTKDPIEFDRWTFTLQCEGINYQTDFHPVTADGPIGQFEYGLRFSCPEYRLPFVFSSIIMEELSFSRAPY